MLNDAIELHRQGRIDEAEAGYRAWLEQHPDDVDGLLALGMLRGQRGDFGEGAQLLERVQALSPGDPEVQLVLASLRFCEGDHEAAQRGFRTALALDPNLQGAHAGLGQIELMRGNRAEAERLFRTALRAGEEPNALAGIGRLLAERGDIDGALRHVGRAAELAPNDAMIQFLLGQVFAQRGTSAFAEQAFRNALRLRPDLHAIRFWLGSVLMQAGRTDNAGAVYRELAEVPGHEGAARVGLADVARAQGRYEEAAAAYAEALARTPGQAEPTLAYAWTLAHLGRPDEALAAYDACLAVNDAGSVRLARAQLLGLLGRGADAADEWQRLHERNPSDPNVRGQLALAREQLGDFAAADAHAAAALADTRSPTLQLLCARAHLREGRFDAARATLDALAHELLPPPLAAQRAGLLGRAHDRAGRHDEAVAAFAEAQRGLPVELPVHGEPPPGLDALLAERVAPAWAQAPVLLLGLPGSNVELVGALLARQDGLAVNHHRVNGRLDDDFDQPRFELALGNFDAAARAEVRERWLASMRAIGLPTDRTVVDWLPRWDARLLALVHRAMPGTRIIIVERDPRDELLNWLAHGWAPGHACTDPVAAADWLALARRDLRAGASATDPRRLVVSADALLADPSGGEGRALAQFLGLDRIDADEPPAHARGLGGLPLRFEPGHWRQYATALAVPFARLGVERA